MTHPRLRSLAHHPASTLTIMAPSSWRLLRPRSPAHDCSSGPDAFPASSPAVAEDELHVPAAAPTVSVADVRPASSTRSELSDLAALCTRLARTADPADVAPLFQDAAALLGVVA
jgi:hypothetical protein